MTAARGPGTVGPSTAGPGGTGTGRDRDRDPAGRPRSARPRDGLGRPLARGARGGEPVLPDAPAPEPAQALRLAQNLLDAGRPFHAHEVLEAVWKAAPAGQRPLWRGLAQIAVGLTHARRGNARGAVALLRRGAAAVGAEGADRGAPRDLDAPGVSSAATRLADLIERAGLGEVADGDLVLVLVRQPAAP